MDNENTTVTTEELDAFDDDWDDTPSDYTEAEAADDEEADTPEDEGDTQPDGEEAPEEDGNDSGDEPAEPETEPEPEPEAEEEKPTPTPQTFRLKHLREEKEYSLEDTLAFAQKGLDYDGIRSERDTLRAANKDYEDFLTELARRTGSSDIEEHMVRTRAMWLKADEAEKGNKLSDTDALLKVQKAAKEAADQVAAAKAEEKQPEVEEQPKDNTKMFLDFVKEFPDVKPEEIPQEVWDDFSKNGDLINAYRKYENAKLRNEMKILKQNQKNRGRSTGPRKSAGAATPKDDFDDAWDSF